MRNERLEVIYEHANDIEGPWTEYEFLYKPSNVNSTLRFAGWFPPMKHFKLQNLDVILTLLGPYLPRIDYKLYEAAPSHYRKEVWTLSLAYRLLQGNRNVLALFDGRSTPTTPPTYVRATLYKFRYTTHIQSPQVYWMRLKVSEYFPAFSLDNISPYLRSMKISPNYRETEIDSKWLKAILDGVRDQIVFVEGSVLVNCILLTAIVIVVTKKVYRSFG